MDFDKLELGMKIEIKLSDVEKSPKFISQFEGVEEDKFCISAPIYGGVVQPIELGTILEIYFVQKDNFYKFEAKVIGRGKKSVISVLKIEALSEIEKIQRREFFRFECINLIKYRVIEPSNVNLKKKKELRQEKELKQEKDFKKTITRDLSGGGVCIRLIEKVNIGDIIECELFLGDFDKVYFLGEIVRFTQYGVMKGIYKYEIGVLFYKIDDKSREKIVSYIFQEQRRLIKKG